VTSRRAQKKALEVCKIKKKITNPLPQVQGNKKGKKSRTLKVAKDKERSRKGSSLLGGDGEKRGGRNENGREKRGDVCEGKDLSVYCSRGKEKGNLKSQEKEVEVMQVEHEREKQGGTRRGKSRKKKKRKIACPKIWGDK